MKETAASIISRRRFIRQAACAALGTGALSAAIRDLRFVNSAVAQSAITDYRALVCIFLAGGLWLWVTDKGAVDDCGRAVR